MTRALYVAAGGGGDAIAAAMLHRLTCAGDITPPVIATWAWERLAVDPRPGPRSACDFDGLIHPALGVSVMTPDTRPRSSSGSHLPRLTAELGATLLLIDPSRGCVGLAEQLDSAAIWSGADYIELVDVGGDILGQPGDLGLRSPMADIASLVAVTAVGLPATVTVFGPGADGELSETLVEQRLREARGRQRATLDAETANRFLPLLDWNPSEATAILIAAALGHRGRVEMRDQGLPVELTDRTPTAWSADVAAVPARVARLAATRSELDLRSAVIETYGVDEIGYEERKAEAVSQEPTGRRGIDPDSVMSVLTAARHRGTAWCTRRRLREALHADVSDQTLRQIVGDCWQPPLIATTSVRQGEA